MSPGNRSRGCDRLGGSRRHEGVGRGVGRREGSAEAARPLEEARQGYQGDQGGEGAEAQGEEDRTTRADGGPGPRVLPRRRRPEERRVAPGVPIGSPHGPHPTRGDLRSGEPPPAVRVVLDGRHEEFRTVFREGALEVPRSCSSLSCLFYAWTTTALYTRSIHYEVPPRRIS